MALTRRLVAFATIALWSSVASAATIDISTVVQVDDFKFGVDIGNSEHAEEAYLASYLGLDPSEVTYTKIDIGGSAWFEVLNESSGDLWAFDFSPYVTNPLVFLVKFGNAVHSHYVYENLSSFRYGVIDLDEPGIVARSGTITIASVSHAGTAGTATVPEPGSFALLLVGLAGLGASSRRSSRSRM